MTARKHPRIESRNDRFVEHSHTRIWQEIPTARNPYIAAQSLCHGYDLLELMQKRSYVDVLFLLFRGDLPNAGQAELLQRLMIALINPGPRHAATRAAMNAGVGKTDTMHILPIALSIIGGDYQGAGGIETAMRFVRRHAVSDPGVILEEQLQASDADDSGDCQIAPGFGSYYGGIDCMAANIAAQLLDVSSRGKCLHWGQRFATLLASHNMGWHLTGVAAAVFADLGFQPRLGGGLFQLLRAPGLLAHGIEMSNKPTTAMPFVRDENYVIETK